MRPRFGADCGADFSQIQKRRGELRLIALKVCPGEK